MLYAIAVIVYDVVSCVVEAGAMMTEEVRRHSEAELGGMERRESPRRARDQNEVRAASATISADFDGDDFNGNGHPLCSFPEGRVR